MRKFMMEKDILETKLMKQRAVQRFIRCNCWLFYTVNQVVICCGFIRVGFEGKFPYMASLRRAYAVLTGGDSVAHL